MQTDTQTHPIVGIDVSASVQQQPHDLHVTTFNSPQQSGLIILFEVKNVSPPFTL
jgi:hypothetical protein